MSTSDRAQARAPVVRVVLVLALGGLALMPGWPTGAVASPAMIDQSVNPPRVIPAAVLDDVDLSRPMSAEAAGVIREQVRDLRETLGDALTRERIDCYRRFFTAHCLNEVGLRERAVTARLDAVEVHVNQRLRDEEALQKNRRVADEMAQRQAAQATEAERARANRLEHEARLAAALESQQRREQQAPEVARRAETLRQESERKQRVLAERRAAAERREQQAPAKAEARQREIESHRREQAQRAERDAQRAAKSKPERPSQP